MAEFSESNGIKVHANPHFALDTMLEFEIVAELKLGVGIPVDDHDRSAQSTNQRERRQIFLMSPIAQVDVPAQRVPRVLREEEIEGEGHKDRHPVSHGVRLLLTLVRLTHVRNEAPYVKVECRS